MKNLQYILETKLDRKTLVDFIKSNIDNEGIDDVTLRRIYDILNNHTGKAEFERILQTLGLDQISDNILSYFDKFGQTSDIIEYIISNDKVNVKEIITKQNGNIFDIFEHPNNKFSFERKALQRLAKETTAGGVKVGEFEYLMRLFLDGVDITNHTGDIVCISNGNAESIEMKCGSARINGAGTASADTITVAARKNINEMSLSQDIKNELLSYTENFNCKGGIKIAPNFFEKVYNLIEDKKLLVDLMLNSYNAQYSNSKNTNSINDIEEFLIKKLFTSNRLNKDSILPCIATITLINYHLLEGFKYFLLINKENGNFHCINFNSINLERIYNFFITEAKIKSIQNADDKMYGKGIQIEYK